MRIAIVTDAWHPQVSGVVTTYTQTINQLNVWGHEVEAITPEDFKTIPCPTYRSIPLSLFPKKKVFALLDEFSPHAIHIATEGPLGWAARSYCLNKGIGYTTTYHSRFPEYVRLRLPIPLWLSYGVVRRFHTPAVRTMVATPDLRDELATRGFTNLCLWSRGVDTDLFKPRDKGFLPDPRPISLYTGRVAVEKNIEAFLKLELPGTKYVIGDGPALAELRERYPQVRFPGFKRGKELSRYMAAADVFVFPSLTDTFGVVMLEAMACGLPVAAFPVTGPKQVVRQSVTGVLDDDLALAVRKALTLDGRKCRESAKRFSWEACSRQFLDNLHVLDENELSPESGNCWQREPLRGRG